MPRPPTTTWLVTHELTWMPDHAVSTPDGALTSIVSLLRRISEQLIRVGHDQGLVLLDRQASHTLGLDVDPVDGQHRALDYAAAQGWKHTALGAITGFFAKGRPSIYVGQLPRLEHAGPDFWPWGFRRDDTGALHYRWPADVVTALNHWQRLSGVAWQAGPAVMGIELMHATLRPYRMMINGKSKQFHPEKRCDATPDQASEPAWSPAMWSRPAKARCAHQLDRIRAGLTAAGAAKLSGPKLTRGWREFDGLRAGWWQFSMPPWNDPRIPHPLGPGRVYDRVWRTTDTLCLGAELAAQGLLDMPEMIDSLTGPARTLLLPWQQHVESIYAAPAEDGYDDDDHRPLVQNIAQDVAKRGMGMLAKADRNSSIWRPDWHAAIDAAKRCNGWRRAWRIGLATDLWPVAVDDDAWWYASDQADPHKAMAAATSVLNTRGEPLLDLTHDRPGAYRVKQTRTREMVTK